MIPVILIALCVTRMLRKLAFQCAHPTADTRDRTCDSAVTHVPAEGILNTAESVQSIDEAVRLDDSVMKTCEITWTNGRIARISNEINPVHLMRK